jgi:hypothetical protein
MGKTYEPPNLDKVWCSKRSWTYLMDERLTLLFRIPEVPVSNLGSVTSYSDSFFRYFPQSLQANARSMPQN